MEISYFRSGEFSKVTGSVELSDFFDYVRDGRWQDKILAVRTGKVEKKLVPSVTVSGSFRDRRAKTNLSQHSGLIGIDLDADDNLGLLEKRTLLEQDAYCYACHVSIRGFGLVWYVKVPPEKHLESFRAIEKYLANEYNVVVDPSGKDVSRLRFVSYDPHLYQNEKSKKWHKVLNKAEREPIQAPRAIAYHDSDMAHIMGQIQKRGVNIAEDYHSWLNISFALAREFNEQGRAYFHTISQQSAKYDQEGCDKQFNVALKRDHAGGIGIGTFFYYCRQAGLETRTRETLEIEAIFRQRRKSEPKLDPEEAVKSTVGYMEMKGVGPERTRATLEGVKDLPVNQFQVVKGNDQVLEMETFITGLGLRFNEITRYLEIDGTAITDRDFGTIYRKAMHAIDFKVSREKLFALMDSDLIESYNPFMDFFKEHEHMKPEGKIQEVMDCFEYEKLEDWNEDVDYLEHFMEKWMLGIISAMNGTFSLLTLVLCGSQGTGKTNFFRKLLPQDLKKYYADHKLDIQDNHIGMIMSKKLLVCDDEFSGKNKRDASKFKELVSKETFYLKKPYGKVYEDVIRYAVLCGTSNEYTILNDVTGNRRIIPVNVINIDHDRFERIDKTELFMELYWKWKETGNKWMLNEGDKKMLHGATRKNEGVDFERDLIQNYLRPAGEKDLEVNIDYMNATDATIYLEQFTKTRITPQKIGTAMNALGFVQKNKKINGNSVKKYRCVKGKVEKMEVDSESWDPPKEFYETGNQGQMDF